MYSEIISKNQPPINYSITGIPNSIVDAAKGKLKVLLKEQYPNLDPNDIILENFKCLVWSDSSIGCPEEGHFYLPVLTPGYSIGFQIGENHYRMHTDQTGSLIASPDFPANS